MIYLALAFINLCCAKILKDEDDFFSIILFIGNLFMCGYMIGEFIKTLGLNY